MTLLGILIAIFIIYRLSKLAKLLFLPQFWIGAAINTVYILLVATFIDEMDLSFGEGFAFSLVALIILIFFALIIRPMGLPLVFLLGIVSVGLIIFNINIDTDVGEVAAPPDAIPPSNDLAAAMAAESTTIESGADPGVHHVDAHWVDGYTRADGTFVEGHWRDGDGNPNTTLSEQQGGYMRSNPDGNPFNNLKK
jgi:hypothetical protein